jgi:phospholipase C
MQNGDAPVFKSLADNYNMSDNYHQPVLGGTGPDSQPLGFADQVFFSDGMGNPATPLATNIYNPDPVAGTLNLYTHRAQWFNCNDPSQPGIGAVAKYLSSLPYKVDTKCGPGQYWQAVNVNPAFTPKGLPQTGLIVPQTNQRSIGDVLTASTFLGNIMVVVSMSRGRAAHWTGPIAITLTLPFRLYCTTELLPLRPVLSAPLP